MSLHLAVILDGNRRWAKKKLLPVSMGHRQGAKRVQDLINWCPELGITQLTLYCFSTENFNRSKEEVQALFNLFRSEFKQLWNENDQGIKIQVIGQLEKLPEDLQDMCQQAMQKTKSNSKLTVNFALGYGSKEEIVRAAQKVQQSNTPLTEESLTEHLYLSNEPDIFLRPGGEKRLSNFLLWQSSYSELFFIDTLWPDVKKEDIQTVINEFQTRKRRFGT